MIPAVIVAFGWDWQMEVHPKPSSHLHSNAAFSATLKAQQAHYDAITCRDGCDQPSHRGSGACLPVCSGPPNTSLGETVVLSLHTWDQSLPSCPPVLPSELHSLCIWGKSLKLNAGTPEFYSFLCPRLALQSSWDTSYLNTAWSTKSGPDLQLV